MKFKKSKTVKIVNTMTETTYFIEADCPHCNKTNKLDICEDDNDDIKCYSCGLKFTVDISELI